MQRLTGFFQKRDEAERAVRALLDAGFDNANLDDEQEGFLVTTTASRGRADVARTILKNSGSITDDQGEREQE